MYTSVLPHVFILYISSFYINYHQWNPHVILYFSFSPFTLPPSPFTLSPFTPSLPLLSSPTCRMQEELEGGRGRDAAAVWWKSGSCKVEP